MTSATRERPIRPANRRALIAHAAARAFAERGYHAVSMEEIAADVGITAAALYRHFPNKYALFVHCVTELAGGLAAALNALPADADLGSVLTAAAKATVANRAIGGIYRWEDRYLVPPERDTVRATFEAIVERVGDAIVATRTDGSSLAVPSRRLLASGALGAIGSATAHRTTMGTRRLEGLLAGSAYRVASVDLAIARGGGAKIAAAAQPAPGTARAPRKQQILDAAVPLFYRDGYAEVSMAQIAAAVGLAPSGLYRHYAGKADILLAACLQAAVVLDVAARRGLAAASGPDDEVGALAKAYVGYAFEHTALTSVATAEAGLLPADVQRRLKVAQREFVGGWAERLRAARPDLDPVEARVLVHAALGVVTEAGRALRWEDTADSRAVVGTLALAALGP